MGELEKANKITDDFDAYESKYASKTKQLLSTLDEKYLYDYIVFSASESITEEKIIWEMPYSEVIKRLMFKKFNSFMETHLSDGTI